MNHVVEKEGNKFIVYDERNPSKKLDPNDVETQIDIYENSTRYWFFNVAERLKQDNEAGFVVLQLAISYIESIEQYKTGKSSNNDSKSFFSNSLKKIFPEIKFTKEILDHIYDEVRSGLVHNAITKKDVVISTKFQDTIKIENKNILINPHKFLDRIIYDFEEYIKKLRNENEVNLRERFKTFFMMDKSVKNKSKKI